MTDRNDDASRDNRLGDLSDMEKIRGLYVLDGHEPVPASGLMQWLNFLAENNRTLEQTVGTSKSPGNDQHEVTVSTVFLAVDHSMSADPPILFETMIFGGPMDRTPKRSVTWDEALETHKEMCNRAGIA